MVRDGNSKQVILVEPSLAQREAFEQYLKIAGYGVRTFGDGLEAWSYLRSIADTEEIQNISAVVSDIVMPKMDGLRLLKNIRAHDKLGALPVLLVTGLSDAQHIQLARFLKVSAYLTKPIRAEKLVEKIKALAPVIDHAVELVPRAQLKRAA